jgi:hypothetical protein
LEPVSGACAPAAPAPPAGRSLAFETGVTLAEPHAPPRILAVAVSPSRVRAGQVVSGHVRTTSNVASVEIRVEGFSASMLRRSIGDFTLNYSVPFLPPWLHRKYPVLVIARNVDGVSETRTIEITVE